MLTRLIARNFKRFADVDVELGSPVVFVGPNDSGKTSALQALALWHVGLRRWQERRGGRDAPEKRPGVTINRRDLIAVPVPDANLLWRDLHVRNVTRTNGEQRTNNIRIDITVHGVDQGAAWECGLEFDYANAESFYCRPLRLDESGEAKMPIPPEAQHARLAFLPPMSGLAANETRLDPGAILVRLGEGRTAEVLRNLCHRAATESPDVWRRLVEQLRSLFPLEIDDPVYVAERGEIEMTYRVQGSGVKLDLSSSGRGFQQTLLLLAHLAANPSSTLLLDEPDAHLEILRQRQVYRLLVETAERQSSQVIAASHSEVILNEAADRDVVVAFVGKPHRIDDRGSQLLKSLKEIGFEQYYQAEQTGWVLYLEGSTDLAILQVFADVLSHPCRDLLERPFIHYVGNQPQAARHHFNGLREAKQDLCGFLLCDRLERALQSGSELVERMWRRCEIENYLCQRETLVSWARSQDSGLLAAEWAVSMSETIDSMTGALSTLDKPSPWSPDLKVTDEFLDPLFARFFKARGLANLMRKTDYHMLARHVPPDQLDPEVSEVLDAIWDVARRAHPA